MPKARPYQPGTRKLLARNVVGAEPARVTRYLLMGGVAWLVDIAVFSLCLPGLGVVLAQVSARTAGAVVAFVGHKLVVFRALDSEPATVGLQLVGYSALWVFSLGVSTLALIGLIEHVHFNPVAAKILVETGIVVLNYLVMRTVIFRTNPIQSVNE